MNKRIQWYIHKNAVKADINKYQAEDIWDSIWEFVRATMKEGDLKDPTTYKNIFIRNFGTFYANQKHINKVKELKNENIQSEGE